MGQNTGEKETMIPLMKSAFLREDLTRKLLADFLAFGSRLSMGDKCEEFEREFAKYQGRKYCVLFNSGASANLALLQSMKNSGELKDGDRIGFSAVTWATNVMPIIQLGMVPVPVDVDPRTLNCMSSNMVQSLRHAHLHAFFITNALGFAGDLAEIRRVCRQRAILLIEDNCECLGTILPEGMTGNFGKASTFSFFVAHHMSTIEGGAVCTDDENLFNHLKMVRANGWDRNLCMESQKKLRREYGINDFDAKYTFYNLAYNLRPTEITGQIGLSQIPLLSESRAIRQENYVQMDTSTRENEDLLPIETKHLRVISNFAFPVVCKTKELREKYIKRFTAAGVEVRPMIAGNMQRQPFYKKHVEKMYPLPGADFLHDCAFYFGNYPELSHNDMETLSQCLKK